VSPDGELRGLFCGAGHFAKMRIAPRWRGRRVPGVEVFGGVTLNPSVGGLNPAVVKATIAVGAKIEWLPTLFATNHREREGRDGGVRVVAGDSVVVEVEEFFR
jgi:hypothetical protein